MLTSEAIVAIVGTVVSLVFSYFPALRTKFAAMTTEAKSAYMIGMMVLAAFGVWGAGCAGWIDAGVACSVNSIPELLKLIFLAIVANQAVHRISPQAPDVTAVKQARG